VGGEEANAMTYWLTVTVRVATKEYAHGENERASAELTAELNLTELLSFETTISPLVCTALTKLDKAQAAANKVRDDDEIPY
jgi:hypothetical protein